MLYAFHMEVSHSRPSRGYYHQHFVVAADNANDARYELEKALGERLEALVEENLEECINYSFDGVAVLSPTW